MNWQWDWGDRPLNILWLIIALLTMYGISTLLGRNEALWENFPASVSFTTKVILWRWVVPIVIGGGMIWFLMRVVRKHGSGQVFIDRNDHGNHGGFHG